MSLYFSVCVSSTNFLDLDHRTDNYIVFNVEVLSENLGIDEAAKNDARSQAFVDFYICDSN